MANSCPQKAVHACGKFLNGPLLSKDMNQLKVMQVLPELESGGVERGTLELAKFLAGEGHQSVVVSAGGGLVERLETEGSRHVTWDLGRKSLLTLRHVRPFRRFLETERPDILHLRSRCPAWVAWLAWRKMDPMRRPRLVTTVHGFNSVNRYSEIMTAGERVIAVSESVRDYVLKHYRKVAPDKVRVVHRGIDPADYPFGYRPSQDWLEEWRRQFPQLEGRVVLTLPGRITSLKGHDDLFQAVALLREHGLPAHGLIVGGVHPRKKAYKRALEQKAIEKGIIEEVTFTGARADLREILSISDVVLSLSARPESFGRTALEALSLGRPVIGYDYGGVGEQLKVLFPEGAVPPGDVQEVVRTILTWGARPPEPRRGNPFTLEAMLRKTVAVYDELLDFQR